MTSRNRKEGRSSMLRVTAAGLATTIVVGLSAGVAPADTGHLVIGARPEALGGAYVALADDASATYWNPAGLADLESREITYTYWRLSDVTDVGVNFAAVAVPLQTGRWPMSVGLSVVRVGASLEEGPTARESKISDSRYSLSLGVELDRVFSVGAALNRLQVDSDAESGSGFGFELGVRAQPFREHALYLAAMGRNLSADVKNESLEEAWRFGLAWTTWQERVTVVGDVNIREDINSNEGRSTLWHGGLELTPVPEFSLRGGYGGRRQWGVGFGVNQRNVYLDYAMSEDDDVLGRSHRFTVSYRFGEGASQ